MLTDRHLGFGIYLLFAHLYFVRYSPISDENPIVRCRICIHHSKRYLLKGNKPYRCIEKNEKSTRKGYIEKCRAFVVYTTHVVFLHIERLLWTLTERIFWILFSLASRNESNEWMRSCWKFKKKDRTKRNIEQKKSASENLIENQISSLVPRQNFVPVHCVHMLKTWFLFIDFLCQFNNWVAKIRNVFGWKWSSVGLSILSVIHLRLFVVARFICSSRWETFTLKPWNQHVFSAFIVSHTVDTFQCDSIPAITMGPPEAGMN